ncbi:hypothetical protein LCGC14_1405650 [marine sediment metagenome]|uniref:Uncharacterized protein n=1 Tax=marine sediment metagenome TaxID=412755 RepID=A0A0F9JVS2_9ZZZZ
MKWFLRWLDYWTVIPRDVGSVFYCMVCNMRYRSGEIGKHIHTIVEFE